MLAHGVDGFFVVEGAFAVGDEHVEDGFAAGE